MENQNIMLQNYNIEEIQNNSHKNSLIHLKDELNFIILRNIQDKNQSQKVIDNISNLIGLLQEIYKEKMEKLLEKYEYMLKRDEQTIRILYKNLLTYKLLKDSLDNRIRILLIKEKEYELMKEKTGAYVKNGEIIYNKQKDNEIIILRAENSNLKNIVENYEKIISDKDLIYENLKNKYNYIQNKIKNKTKKLSISNININLNDSKSLTNIHSNACHYSVKANNFKKVWINSDKKSYKNFNYIKYKNIGKISKKVPFNNTLSSKNFVQQSILDLSPKDIFGVKNNNSNSKNKEKKRKLIYEKQKDICSLKKKNFNLNTFKKNQFNLLQDYTANSSKSLNKSPAHKKLATYSNDDKISSYNTKNNNSQKINFTNHKKDNKKKINKELIDIEKQYKSYINSIPLQKENINHVRKENNNYNTYKLIYSKKKKESYSKELYNKKNNYKKFNNINTNKIFLPYHLKKNSMKIQK